MSKYNTRILKSLDAASKAMLRCRTPKRQAALFEAVKHLAENLPTQQSHVSIKPHLPEMLTAFICAVRQIDGQQNRVEALKVALSNAYTDPTVPQRIAHEMCTDDAPLLSGMNRAAVLMQCGDHGGLDNWDDLLTKYVLPEMKTPVERIDVFQEILNFITNRDRYSEDVWDHYVTQLIRPQIMALPPGERLPIALNGQFRFHCLDIIREEIKMVTDPALLYSAYEALAIYTKYSKDKNTKEWAALKMVDTVSQFTVDSQLRCYTQIIDGPSDHTSGEALIRAIQMLAKLAPRLTDQKKRDAANMKVVQALSMTEIWRKKFEPKNDPVYQAAISALSSEERDLTKPHHKTVLDFLCAYAPKGSQERKNAEAMLEMIEQMKAPDPVLKDKLGVFLTKHAPVVR